MHQLILLTEEQDEAWRCPLKIGRLYINRLIIDEEAAFELLATFELKKSSQRISDIVHDIEIFERKLEKGMGSIEKGAYKILKDTDSPDISNKVTVAADVTNNPWNAEKDVVRASYNNYTDDLAQIRADHPVQSYLNPLTSGPMGTLVGHVSGGIENIKRTVASPTTTSGDTLVYNQVRR